MAEDGEKTEGRDLLEELNLDEVSSMEEVQVARDRPLPKKVELDIDDILLGADEEEAPPEKESEPEEKPPVEAAAPEEPPARKVAKSKLVLLMAVGLVILAAAVGGVYIMLPQSQPVEEAPLKSFPLQAGEIALEPFTIGFSRPAGEMVVRMTLAASFPDAAGKARFEEKLLTVRDLIFRYVQAQTAFDPADQNAVEALGASLTTLVNQALGATVLQDLHITELSVV